MEDTKQDTSQGLREIGLEECAAHKTTKSCWIALFGKVYDVTPFLDDHPGGDDVILENAGTDATEPFEEIGHSNNAVQMLDKYEIGKMKESDKVAPKNSTKAKRGASIPASQSTGIVKAFQVLLPVLLLVVALLVKSMSDKLKKEA